MVIVLLIWATFLGYELGYSKAQSDEMVLQTRIFSSQPDTYDPYTYVFAFQGNKMTVYVPIVFLAPGYDSQIYVIYSCSGDCFFQNVSTYEVSSISPLILRVQENGSESTNSAAVILSSPTVVEENANSETGSLRTFQHVSY